MKSLTLSKPLTRGLGFAVLCSLLCVLAACTVTPASSVQTGSQAGQGSNGAESASVQAAQEPNSTEGAQFSTVTADAGGFIYIPEAGITEQAQYFNYDAAGTIVQLLGIRDSAGKARIALNTCQSCSPSPRAYYAQDGNVLVCQNCGLEFAINTVGSTAASGCNPTRIETLQEVDGEFVIDAAELDAYAPAFTTWQGPTQ